MLSLVASGKPVSAVIAPGNYILELTHAFAGDPGAETPTGLRAYPPRAISAPAAASPRRLTWRYAESHGCSDDSESVPLFYGLRDEGVPISIGTSRICD